jgi:hypothetical protein
MILTLPADPAWTSPTGLPRRQTVAGAVDLDLYRRIGHDVITEEL